MRFECERIRDIPVEMGNSPFFLHHLDLFYFSISDFLPRTIAKSFSYMQSFHPFLRRYCIGKTNLQKMLMDVNTMSPQFRPHIVYPLTSYGRPGQPCLSQLEDDFSMEELRIEALRALYAGGTAISDYVMIFLMISRPPSLSNCVLSLLPTIFTIFWFFFTACIERVNYIIPPPFF